VPDAIESVLSHFTGDFLQTPPAFSAIKIDGERAYDLARAGETVEIEPRPVRIDALDLVATPDPGTAAFEARCGKGTYVRALARDMGRALGCLGHVTQLRRTRVGPFSEADAVSMAALQEAARQGEDQALGLLLPVEAALSGLAVLNVGQNDASRLLRGQSVLIRGRDALPRTGPTYATCKGHLIAVGCIEKGELRPSRVFNFGEGR
jgi:tRNA pseudouridine55 synthase